MQWQKQFVSEEMYDVWFSFHALDLLLCVLCTVKVVEKSVEIIRTSNKCQEKKALEIAETEAVLVQGKLCSLNLISCPRWMLSWAVGNCKLQTPSLKPAVAEQLICLVTVTTCSLCACTNSACLGKNVGHLSPKHILHLDTYPHVGHLLSSP